MKAVMLISLLSLELSYYLLIIQTGIVEFYASDIFAILTLPIGGILGSLLSPYTKISSENKLTFFIAIQLFVSFFYPNLSAFMLFILGFSSGVISVLMIHKLKSASRYEIGVALSISYVIGTLLFNYDIDERDVIALLFSLIVLIASRFLPKEFIVQDLRYNHKILTMFIWVLLDATLFEMLSRDSGISIWRDGFSYEIAIFHVIGVFLALSIKSTDLYRSIVIFVLFFFSYLFYYLKEPYILSAIYPIAISYYNIVILQTILKKDIKTISYYMVFIAWLATGLGLELALIL